MAEFVNVNFLSQTNQNRERGGTCNLNTVNIGGEETDPGYTLPAAFLHHLSLASRLFSSKVYDFSCRELL